MQKFATLFGASSANEKAESVVKADAFTGAAVFYGPIPFDAAFSCQESRLRVAARGSPLTFGKENDERRVGGKGW